MYKSEGNVAIGNCACNFNSEPPTWENIEGAKREIWENSGTKTLWY